MLTDEQGVQAIIALQKKTGITEPEERAKREWATFSGREKIQTEEAHKVVCGGFKKEA